MGSTQRKTTTRSKSGRTKRKPANSTSTTKALVNKADHVRRQALKPGPTVRAPGRGTNERLSSNGPEVLRTAANENLRPALSGLTQALAFWSPIAVLLRQQSLLASMSWNVIQSQRLWAQAWTRSA